MHNIVLLTDYSHELYLQRTLGAYKVAAALRLQGYNVRVIDFLHCFSASEILSILDHAVDEHTLFVGFSTFFYRDCEDSVVLDRYSWEKGGKRYGAKKLGSMIPHGLQHNKSIADTIRKRNSKCKLVLGGPDAQDLDYIRDYDYTVIGYADCSIIDLANHLSKQTSLPNARRSVHGSCIVDDAAAPGYNFVNTPMFYQSSDLIGPNETLVIEISRGCIFQCAFCSYPLNGKRKNDHVKLESVLEQEFLHNWETYGVTRYVFSDDTFNDSVDKINMIARIAKKLPFRLEYWAYVRLDLLTAHPETVDTLFDSGCRACHFGIETLNPHTASIIGKGGDRARMARTVDYIKNRYGDSVSLNGSFIFGLPHESIASMKDTARFLIDGKFQLDSWNIYPLMIKGSSARYQSDIDLNFERHGYTLGGWLDQYAAFFWRNDETNFEEVLQLAADTVKIGQEIAETKINGQESFYISGTMRIPLEYSLNKTVKNFDWYSVELKKQAEAEKYRQKLFASLGMVDQQMLIV